MQERVRLPKTRAQRDAEAGYISMIGDPSVGPTNGDFDNAGFTSYQSSLHQSNNSLELTGPIAPQNVRTDVPAHAVIQPRSRSHSPTAPARAPARVPPKAPPRASQGSASQKKKKFIVVIIIIICLFVIFIVGGLTFMGKYLSGKRDFSENLETSTTTKFVYTEDDDWTSTTSVVATAESTHHDSFVSSTPFSNDSAAIGDLQACQTATNLTRSWRMDHNGSDIRPGFGPHANDGYACDFHENLKWFRFTGEAGNRLLNTCPPLRSCGGFYSFWTDSKMPQQVGAVSPIFVYSRHAEEPEGDCKEIAIDAVVVRCSWDTDHDYIYNIIGKKYEQCVATLCGMR
ncbi:uncharacterized protein [Watersipora subatra]|uniref:uncharacterized protein isoform X2 n=1 Tax=Watersipora subatra TaxID=2589382 RepID=UPI00355B802C